MFGLKKKKKKLFIATEVVFSLFFAEIVSGIRPQVLLGDYRLVGVSSFLPRSESVDLSNARDGFTLFSRSCQEHFAWFDHKL